MPPRCAIMFFACLSVFGSAHTIRHFTLYATLECYHSQLLNHNTALHFPALPHSPASSHFLFILQITKRLVFCCRDLTFGAGKTKCWEQRGEMRRVVVSVIGFTWHVCTGCLSFTFFLLLFWNSSQVLLFVPACLLNLLQMSWWTFFVLLVQFPLFMISNDCLLVSFLLHQFL